MLELLGGVRATPISPLFAGPEPRLPADDNPEFTSTDGGGGMTLLASSVPFGQRLFPLPWESDSPTDGGGGTTLWLSEVPRALTVVEPEDGFALGGGGITFAPSDVCLEPPDDPAEGGGGITLAVRVPLPARIAEGPEETAGGGGTTSCVPKILPITLLKKDVLLVEDGGGGITLGEAAASEPLSRRRRSCAESAEGGGATTEGAGNLSFAVRADALSGAETGGGTTDGSFILTDDRATSRPTDAGAGGTTLA